MKDNKLVIALTKGRVLEEVLPMLEAAGISPAENLSRSRRLIFESKDENTRLMIIRGSDVPTYVELGGADVGITGKDILLEHDSDEYYELLDLRVAPCRLMTAVPVGMNKKPRRLRVATKYVNVARNYYSERGRQADVIKLNGALEIAPIMGLADCIVDIVETGNTLRSNGLEPQELIASVSARVIVNKASMKTKHTQVHDLIDRLSAVAAARAAAENSS